MATTKTIGLLTAIPGPRSKEVLERKQWAVANAKTIALPVVVAEARGATITDVDGNVFIDFTGGVGCLNVGHAHPRVVEAAQEQAALFMHTDFTVVPYELYVSLAERLLEQAPFSGPAKAAFFNAGTEAVENAVKFARLYTRRPAVIAFEGAFHGRTLLSMTLTSKPHPYKIGMGPLAPEVYRAPFPQDYRGPDSATALEELKQLFVTQVAAEQVAAIVIEPDLITLAKSIAGGLPLSGVLGKAEIMDAAHDGAVGGTFVGNPVAQAAAHAVLDVIEDEGLCERATAIGETMRSRMLEWQERFAAVGDVRGLGAMLAIELVRDRVTKQPAPDLAQRVIDAATERGLLLLKAGVYSNCIRVLCPLVISDAELDEALAVWEEALATTLA